MSSAHLRRALLTLCMLGLTAVVAMGWSGSASAVSLAASTTTTLTVSPGSVALDGEFTLTATVTGLTTAPQGSVKFFGDDGLIATQTLTPTSTTTSTATITLPNTFTAGAHMLTATFAGNPFTWLTSTSDPVTLQVGAATIVNSTTTLTVSPSPAEPDAEVTLTARVTRDDGATPTGTVTFRDNGNLVGTANLVDGVATITRNDFPAGTHSLLASYVGPTNDVTPSSDTAQLVVNEPTVVPAVETTIGAWSVPTTIRAGDVVTLKAHVVQVGTQTSPPGGPVVTFRNVTNGANTYVGEAQLDANGDATITVPGWTEGTYKIKAEYFGDLYNLPSAGTFTVSVVPRDASVTLDTTLVAAPATAAATTAATLAATLTTAGVPVVGETVTLAAAGASCTATTGSTGVATCTVPVNVAAGSYPITATYGGSSLYNGSTGASTLLVTKRATSLSVPPIAVASGGSATLSATLSAGASPVAGRQVTLTAGTQSCAATTTAAGVASCTIAFAQLPGSYALNASFAGDTTYAASAGVGTLTAIGKPTRLLVLPSVGVYHHAAILSGRLTDQSGAPLPNQAVTLTVGSRSCTGTTDGLGVAACTIMVDEAPGTADVVGTFAGAVGYAAATATGTIAIAKQPTVLKITSSLVQQSGTVVVTAKLLDDTGLPIAGAPVTLTLGSSTQSATTNADGIASASFAGRAAGSYAVVASYAGDPYYAASASSAGDKVTCYDQSRFLVWGGNATNVDEAVRVGDHFVFWGAQWSKQVVRGDYAGGSSLKGWADSVSGSSWSTSTGNSTSAPKSIGSYISVLVTTKVAENGSTLTGNAVRRVVIRVDDPSGYDANPGHAAAGTVVAIL